MDTLSIFKYYKRYSTARLKIEKQKCNKDSLEYNIIEEILTDRLKIYVHKVEIEITPVHFGNKNEAYFTEREMLKGFTCKYDDLSNIEKQIYKHGSRTNINSN